MRVVPGLLGLLSKRNAVLVGIGIIWLFPAYAPPYPMGSACSAMKRERASVMGILYPGLSGE